MTDFYTYTIDDVEILDDTSDEPTLSTVDVMAHASPTDDTPVHLVLPGRLRLRLSIDKLDEVCAELQRAKGKALLAVIRAGESRAVH